MKGLLFNKQYLKEISKKYSNTHRLLLPASAAYVLDKNYQIEKEKVECVYRDYPSSRHKKKIKKNLQSPDNDTFWGAWAELQVFAQFHSRGFDLSPEPKIKRRKPDYLIRYPIGLNSYNEVIIEVTTISTEVKQEKQKIEKFNEVIVELDKIARASKYILYIYIADMEWQKLLLNIDFNKIKKEFKQKLSQRSFKEEEGFGLQVNKTKVNVIIVKVLKKSEGFILDWFQGGFVGKKEIESFKNRIYDRIQGKVIKYQDLEALNKPFLLAIFPKGPLPLQIYKIFNEIITTKDLEELINPEGIEESARIRALSGILFYKTLLFTQKSKYYEIHIDPILYIHPTALNPVDKTFRILYDSLSDPNSSKCIKQQIEEGKFIID